MANGKYTYAIGRRKTSVAQVRLYKGAGDSLVNGKKFEEVFALKTDRSQIMRPFVATDTVGQFHFEAKVNGGGITGQVGAIKLGIARALVELNEVHKTALKAENLITRDPRMKERKKPYLRGARRGKQFSKR